MRDIPKAESLREDVKIARYLLQKAELEGGDQWPLAKVAEQEALIAKANVHISEIWSQHAKAKAELKVLQERVAEKEKLFSDHVNRGQIGKMEDSVERLTALVEQLKTAGKTDAEIRTALGL